MNKTEDPDNFPDPMTLDRNATIETVLTAWHGATLRLEQTHEALRAEVCRLTDELEIKNRELARKNRLADLGQIAAHIAHEVRNNLVPVTLYLSLLRRRISEDSGSLDILAKVEAGFVSLDATVHDLLSFASEREPRRQTFVARALIDEVVASLAPQFEAQGIATRIDAPADMLLQADYGMLRRAVLNLTLNALDAMPEGGELAITTIQTPQGVEIEVADSGPGLLEEAQSRVFEPFFTTKSGGTGLGLAIVDRIAEAHGGKAWCVNCPEGGAAFTLRIPTYQAREMAA